MIEEKEETATPARRKLPVPKVLLWVFGIMAGLALILYIASYFIDEPLRRITEKKVNRDLKGYSVRIPEMHLQLIGLSLTLKGLTVIQQAHPDPPVANFSYIKTSVHWREILSGKLVGELDIDKPKLNINLPQLESEAASKVPMKKQGWQQAVEDIYPLKINLLVITDGDITYIDQDPKRPLVLSHLNIQADNIRNIHLPDKVFPSPFHLETRIFGKGEGVIDGKANFLAEPTPAVKAKIKLYKVPIDYFKPIVARSNLAIAGGVLRAKGDIEYTPKAEIAHLAEVVISGLKVDYIHSEQTAAAEKGRAKVVAKTAKRLSNKPEVLITVDQFELANCNLGMANDAGGKHYRVFLSDTDFHLSNFSNQFSRGAAKMRLSGKFMGSGATSATGDFRAEKKAPDFDIYLKITDTQLNSMNDILRAYGNFDVAAGTFSLVTELHAKDNQLSGYIKPFFKDMKVYDKRKDKEKSLSHKLYERLVGAVANLLQNRPHEQVATKIEISGPLQQPKTSTWQIIVQLVRNAFFKAIMPTFERQVTNGKP